MIRLHIPAIPYTITRDEYSHDAFTNKVKLFSPMMRSVGFEVYHYGVETSESNATKQIDLMTKEEWNELRIKSWQFVDKTLSYDDAKKKNEDHTQVVSQISNWSSPLAKEFNVRFRKHLIENYRSNLTDIVCIPLARTYQDALDKLNYVVVETGIGYSGSYLNYRIFESYSWMSNALGREDKQPNNYWFVIPHAFNIKEFKLSLKPEPRKVGFMGRITSLKGCGIIKEIAKRFPDVQFVLCGQGDHTPYTDIPNVVYKPPIHGSERSEYLGTCVAFLHLAKYLEPFGCGPVEAQLCGTPVICSDWGGMVETVEQGKTGLRGHTVADYCHGVQMALDNKFDRQYIRDRAVRLYDMYTLANNYDYVFRTILDMHTPGKNGWYSPDTHIRPLLGDISKKRIYLIIPYYGAFPNYFQLYLDSLGINTDIMTLFLITDIDMSPYTCPDNLVLIKMPKLDVQKRASKFILDTYNKVIEPENLLKDNYKFVDFKIVYPLLFDDILKSNGVTEEDFVGWGDIDLIYGKLSKFINFKENYGILGGWHGHFTAIQNTDSFKNNFKAIPNYFELITDNSRTFITDEIAYREPLKTYLSANKIKMFYTNAYFCDIVPPCFYHISRPDHKSRAKNFYDVYNPNKNINYLYYDKNLSVLYDTGERRDVLYCHLQKRKMDLPFTSYDKGYYINENSFSISNINEVIPRKIWQTWETHELPPKMKENIDTLKNNHPDFEYNMFDNEERRNFIKDYFPNEIVLAYDALIPGAYKADLWRYCVLYIHGGIYLDVKTQFINGFTLNSLLDKEYIINDGSFTKNNIEYATIYNGIIICKKGNLSLLNAIINIVYNVSTKFMGTSAWKPTGPDLLGNNMNIPIDKIDFSFYGSNGNYRIRDKTGKIISVNYPEYRTEQKAVLKQAYYVDLWYTKSIYNDCTIDLLKIYNEKIWPRDFHNSLEYILNTQINGFSSRSLELGGSLNLDMIYYINLNKRKDRNEHVINQLKKASIPENKVTRFTAIDGDTYEFTKEELELFKNASFLKTPSLKKIMGNQLSHLYIFKDMVEKGYSKILILQDDIVFREGFVDHLNKVLDTLPSDCEILNIGIHEHCYFNEFKAYDLTLNDDYLRIEKKKVNDAISIWNDKINPCSLSYILTLTGAKNMISHFESTGFLRETDIGFNKYLQAKNIFYGSRTVLCTGDPYFGTDIFNTEVWWKKFNA